MRQGRQRRPRHLEWRLLCGEQKRQEVHARHDDGLRGIIRHAFRHDVPKTLRLLLIP